MADDLGPILPQPGEEQPATGIDTPDLPEFLEPEAPPPADYEPATTDAPPIDGLPIDDPLGAPGVGMDVPDTADPGDE